MTAAFLWAQAKCYVAPSERVCDAKKRLAVLGIPASKLVLSMRGRVLEDNESLGATELGNTLMVDSVDDCLVFTVVSAKYAPFRVYARPTETVVDLKQTIASVLVRTWGSLLFIGAVVFAAGPLRRNHPAVHDSPPGLT